MIDFSEHPHRRFNPLTQQWVLVSPHRAKRPWQGQTEKTHEEQRPQHDPTCYLCAGNTRINGEQNPDYRSTFVFTNDFSALLPHTPTNTLHQGLLHAEAEQGLSRVICFSPRHDLTIAEMSTPQIVEVVELWQREYAELGSLPYISHVQLFENKGQVMGSSNPHPHGQIWAQSSVPDEVAKETASQSAYFQQQGRSLLSDYLSQELEAGERIVFQNDTFVCLVPFWAVWPFETMILPKRAIAHIGLLNEQEKTNFADMYRRITVAYDNLFEISFPYSAGIHQMPTDGAEYPEWHLHMHFYPPLLRSATIKKFMVGYEMMAGPQRDITPEQSAERLRQLPTVHYKQHGK